MIIATPCSPRCVSGMANRGRSRRSPSLPPAVAFISISLPRPGCGCATPQRGWAGASTPVQRAVTSSPRAVSSPDALIRLFLASSLRRCPHGSPRVSPSRSSRPQAGSYSRLRSRDTARYGLAVLDRETRRVAQARRGQRNDTLNRAAFALGQLAAAGIVSAELAYAELYQAACRAGLDRDSGRGKRGIRATIRSGLAAGVRKPRRSAA